jgi:osomolarity two-component system response regulator SKN7
MTTPLSNNSNHSSPSLTPQPLQQQQQLPPYNNNNNMPTSTTTTASTSSNSSTTTTTPTAFPLAPYPYPVTMNSVPTSNDFSNNNTNGEIPNVTFWPQQQPQQQDPPPAIIPNDGKFQWAVPSTISTSSSVVMDPVAIAINESNKRRRMNNNNPEQQ